jgi:hypothetical protein
MLRAKENEEFDKWWQHWIATVGQNRMVKHPVSGNEPGDDVERTGGCRVRAILGYPVPPMRSIA